MPSRLAFRCDEPVVRVDGLVPALRATHFILGLLLFELERLSSFLLAKGCLAIAGLPAEKLRSVPAAA